MLHQLMVPENSIRFNLLEMETWKKLFFIKGNPPKKLSRMIAPLASGWQKQTRNHAVK